MKKFIEICINDKGDYKNKETNYIVFLEDLRYLAKYYFKDISINIIKIETKDIDNELCDKKNDKNLSDNNEYLR